MGKEGQRMDIDFGETLNVLKDKYMDVYAEVLQKWLQLIDLMKMLIQVQHI